MASDSLLQVTKLQAVLIADTFDMHSYCLPITLETPKVLMPLGGAVAMLDYAMEMLHATACHEIFVLCQTHAEQITQHIERQKKKYTQYNNISNSTAAKVCVVQTKDCHSIGDALRFLYGIGVITHDFILVGGDVVSTVDMHSVVEAHRERTRKDKLTLMTSVFKRAGPPRTNMTRKLLDNTIVAIDPASKQLLQYDNDLKSSSFSIESELMAQHKNIDIRYDLLDTYIDVCTVEVLGLFADNFDWQDIRIDFVKGVLQSEILGNKIYTYIVMNEYAARVNDWQTYDAVNKDILHRWSYPMVPDNNLIGDMDFSYTRGNIYKAGGSLQVARDSKIGNDVLLSSDVSIASKAQVSSSIIGHGSSIGQSTVIEGSYIWRNVIIGNSVSIDRAVIADNCVIRDGAVVERGAILSFGVVIDENIVVKAYTKITATKDVSDAKIVGKNGIGSLSSAETEITNQDDVTDDDDLDLSSFHLNSLAPDVRGLNTFLQSLEQETEDEVDLVEIEQGKELSQQKTSKQSEADSKVLGSMSQSPSIRPRALDPFDEMSDTMRRNHAQQTNIDDVLVEMSSLKLGHDLSIFDYAAASFNSLFDLVDTCGSDRRNFFLSLTKAGAASLQQVLQRWSAVITKFARTEDEQIMFIDGLETACIRNGGLYMSLFTPTLNILNQTLEIFTDDAILKWARRLGFFEPPTPLHQQLRNSPQLIQFLEWLGDDDDSDDDA